MANHRQAAALNKLGLKRQAQGKLAEAIRYFRRATRADALWSTPYFNLGLVYKGQGRWKQALQYNLLATDLDQDNEAAWWNLGIAATALRKWSMARRAWQGFGLEIPDGRGPVDFPCGFGPVRLQPVGEVVWAYRLDPARTELANVPLPESGFRWRDVVLNDGCPHGYRQYQGQNVPVFDVLQLLRPSRYGTYVARAAVPQSAAPGAAAECLVEVATESGGSAENWTLSTRMLCKACSEGRVHARHDHKRAPPAGVHILGIAARSRRHATDILRAWEDRMQFVEVQSLEVGIRPRRSKR